MGNNKPQNKYLGIDIESLSKEERNELVNSIIDKGLDKLTELDKDILGKISNFKN
jgi:4'-phosphopantetheinyl transferase EntD